MEVARADNPRARLDGATILAAARGEPAAARRLVELTQASVYRYAWRMLGRRASRATAEELVQDVYARVFRALPRYDPHGSARFTTWLLTIAHRTAVDELRRKRPSLVPLNDAPLLTHEERPDQLRERDELAERLVAAVEQLSPALRSAFILRAYHDRDLSEIAAALDIEEGTVKSRLHRARQTLKRALQEAPDAP